MSAGKGSKQRPFDMDKFNEGFDRIFGQKATAAESLNDETTAIPSLARGVPKPPVGYTAEELEQDNPYNQWMHE